MKKLLVLLALVVCSGLHAQTKVKVPEYRKYDWEESPVIDSLTASEKQAGAVIIQDKRIIEFFFDTPTELFKFYTRHVIIHLNTDAAIEQYNKVYIPVPQGSTVVSIQARSISPSGKVTNLPESAVKNVDNYEDRGPFKIFAFEGVEKGGVVEYLYTSKRPRSYSFNYETFRSEYNYRKIEFSIFSPPHLEYDARGYNGLSDPKINDDNDDKFEMNLVAKDVRGFESEKYSVGDGAYPQVHYKLAYNKSQSKTKRVNTWNDAAETYFGLISQASSKDKRKAKSFYKRIGINATMGDEEKIRRIESYVKTHIMVRDDADDDHYGSISQIVSTKIASEMGVLRLYYQLFELAEIRRELVLTSNRFDLGFDGDFDTWIYLQNYLYYFPATGKYLAPTELFFRYGYAPPSWVYQDGLFVRAVYLNNYTTGVGAVKKIGGTTWEDNTNDLYASIKFDFDLGEVNMHVRNAYSGYYAMGYQPIYAYLSQDKQQEMVSDILKGSAGDAKPKNIRVTGMGGEDTLYRHPFTVEADITSNSYLEKAGEKYIFKIGEIIGPQAELYQKSERRTDIALQYPHGFHREIIFTIPEGYKVTNLEALNIDIFHLDGNERTLEFRSSYKVDGDKVTVLIDETYRSTHYPREAYEDFRKVINASADFNKLTLFFEKK